MKNLIIFIDKIILFILLPVSVLFGAAPTLEFYKTASPQYVEGDRTITYRLTIVNGTGDDLNLTVYDNMEDELFTDADINTSIIDDLNISCEVNTGNFTAELTCTDIIVLSGASKQLLYTVIAPDEPMQIENTASLVDNNNDTLAEASVTVTVFPDYEGDLGYERDLCYIVPEIPEGQVCYQSGSFLYGPDCNSSVLIRQDSDKDLKNVHVFKAYTSAITSDACYTQETGEVCGEEKDLTTLLNRDSSLFFRDTFDEAHDFNLGDLDVDENRTIVDINTIPVSAPNDPVTSFQYIALIGQYNYDEDENPDDTIEEYIYPCDGLYSGASISQETFGGINDVDLLNVDITANNAASYIAYETYSKVGTKIVNQPFILGVTYLDPDGNPATYNGQFGNINDIINAPVILQYKGIGEPDSTYKHLWAGELPHDEEHILTIESNLNDGANQNAYPVIGEAFRGCQIKIELIDYGSFFRAIDGLNCGASSLESSLCLVPGCLNSDTQILSVFPLETYPHVATCVYGDGAGAAPCDSNAYNGNCGGKRETISPPKYDNDYGCAQCLADAVSPEVIYNGFSVRPKDFSLNVPEWKNGLNKAGIDYHIDLNATTGTGNPSDISEIDNSTKSSGYNTTLEGYYPSEVIAVIGLEQNASLTCPDENNESQTITFVNGYSSSPIDYHNVGKVKLAIMDQNWTSHDQNRSVPNNSTCILDSNETNPVLDPLNLGRIGCMVITEKSMIFVPDHFEIDANLTDHNNINNFTYLHDINYYDIDDNYSMGASLIMDIKAMWQDENGTSGVTSNYMETCYAKDTNLTLVLDSTNITYPGATPALTQFLYYNPVEDDGTANSGEGNFSFSLPITSPISIPSLPIENIASTFPADAPDGNGTTHIEYKLNFDRRQDLVVNPFRMDLSDVNITDTDEVETTIVTFIDRNATLYYARSRSSKFFYEDIYEPSVLTPIAIDVYCSLDILGWTACNDLGIDTVGGQILDRNWWLSTGHDKNNNDGNITLKEGAVTEGNSADWSVSPIVNITTNAIDPNILVFRGTNPTLPLTVEIELDETNPTDTNHWLIYNPDSDIVPPSPFYKVRFIGDSGWVGVGETGYVLENNASSRKTKRLDW